MANQHSKSSNPGPATVSISMLSHLLMITPQRIGQLIKQGTLPKPRRRGEYDLALSIRNYCRYLQALIESDDLKDVKGEILEEKLRRLRHENDEREARLLPADEVQEMLDEVGAVFDSMFDAAPGRLAKGNAKLRAAAQDEVNRIRDEVNERLMKVAKRGR